ncbi:MAG: class I SAM-dependent methyltransferase [Gemmatimonadota bacterium]|jgi:predicted RNA methylase
MPPDANATTANASPDDRLTSLESHFAFGDNWSSYARDLDEPRIEQAVADLARLMNGAISGRSFFDIGSGSGVHSLAALRLGASRVIAMDLDPASVQTTRQTLSRFAPAGATWEAVERSVFVLDPETHGTYDIVYSWGVLHHTGAMHEAIRRAAALVASGGRFAVALYKKTPMCGLWKHEKRIYSNAGPTIQRLMRAGYLAVMRAVLAVKGVSYGEYVSTYRARRGMDFLHDVHDWLGGYPYESISPAELESFVIPLGFRLERSFVQPQGTGVLGPGCDEFVFVRVGTGPNRA